MASVPRFDQAPHMASVPLLLPITDLGSGVVALGAASS